MIEVSRKIPAVHRMLRPIAGSRQTTPGRIQEILSESIRDNDTMRWTRAMGARMLRPHAIQHYKQALRLASVLTGENIIGSGHEVIVAYNPDELDPARAVRKYATRVVGSPRNVRDEQARRYDKAKAVLGDYLTPTNYQVGFRRGRCAPQYVVMEQPKLDITGDGETDDRVANQRGEFKELAMKLANDEQIYVDVAPGHHNLAVHKVDGLNQLSLVDAVFLEPGDTVRPFLPGYPPNPLEEMRWIVKLAGNTGAPYTM